MVCSVNGCGGQAYVRGMCSKHYNRLLKTGTVEDGPRARLPFRDRLWKNINVQGPDDCWPWTAKSNVVGYGVIATEGRGGKKILAHRAVWIEKNGPLPEFPQHHHGAVIMHTCDNRSCCNPKHLNLGTQADNVRDMDKKGRRKSVSHKGSEHHNSKLTEEMVYALRCGFVTPEEVADQVGMTRKAIARVKNGTGWQHF